MMDFVLFSTPSLTVSLNFINFCSSNLFSEAVLPGAAAFEIAAYVMLKKDVENLKGRAKLGAEAFAQALLVIPKTLAVNGGYDAQETLVKLIEEKTAAGPDIAVGLDLETGGAVEPQGIWDNVTVKKNSISRRQYLHAISCLLMK